MYDTVVPSGWDSVLVGVPFLAMLFCGFFRLDELIASKAFGKSRRKQKPVFSGSGEDGEPVVRDPDGRPSEHAALGR